MKNEKTRRKYHKDRYAVNFVILNGEIGEGKFIRKVYYFA